MNEELKREPCADGDECPYCMMYLEGEYGHRRTCRNIAEEWHKQYYDGFDSLCGTAFVCSECGARICDAEDYFAFMGVPEGDDWRDHRFEPVHFCPNCGAKVVVE